MNPPMQPPGPPFQPPQQPPQSPQAQPMGTIRLTIQGSEMTSNMIVPTCTINGHSVPTRYGVQDLPVWAGPTRVALQAQWIRTYGQAALDVNVAPGQVVPVFYAAPLHQFTTGTIGHTKQSRKGKGCLLSVAGVFLLGAILFTLLVLLSN